MHQLDKSQWWKPEELERAQFRQLEHVLRFSIANVAYYRKRLAGLRLRSPLTAAQWRDLPILSRKDIQDAGSSLRSRRGEWVIVSVQTASSNSNALSPNSSKNTVGSGLRRTCGWARAVRIRTSRSWSGFVP